MGQWDSLSKILLPVIGGAAAAAVGVPPQLGAAGGSALAGAMGGGGEGAKKSGATGGGGEPGAAMDNAGLTSLGLGAIQKLVGFAKQKKANEAFPANEDPELRALATNFARRKRAFQTGTALNSQASNIQALNKQGINAAFNSGSGMAGINRIAQMTNQSMLGLNNQALQGEMAFGQQEGDTINRLVQTRLEKALLKYNQAQADAKQIQSTGNRNMMFGLAKTLPMNSVNPAYGNSFPTMATPGINPDPTQQQVITNG